MAISIIFAPLHVQKKKRQILMTMVLSNAFFMLYAVILKWFVPLQQDELYKVFMQL